MATLWFCLVAGMIAVYVVLDGFVLGAGIIHLLVTRAEGERAQVLRSIGPVWDGNQVWLIAGGGTLFFAFPTLYAASFSGFYLPLMIVLWLLILRGIAIEFRNHIDDHVWMPLWDTIFAGASGMLALFFGAALGNVVRGVPINQEGLFFVPLWTDFRLGKDVGVLDWYTLLAGFTAFIALAAHGGLWVALKTSGELEIRSRQLANRAWALLAGMTVALTIASFRIQPHLWESFRERPWAFIFPFAAIAGLAGMRFRAGLQAFLGSCAYLAGMLTSVAAGLYPYVLPANTEANLGLTVYNAAATRYGLLVGLVWFIPGMALTTGYFVYTYRSFAGKVDQEGSGY
jgi:cytochrome d ubiquinol oxidase subunit II